MARVTYGARHPDQVADRILGLVCADPSIRPGDREAALAVAHERAALRRAGDAFVDAARSIARIVLRVRAFGRLR